MMAQVVPATAAPTKRSKIDIVRDVFFKKFDRDSIAPICVSFCIAAALFAYLATDIIQNFRTLPPITTISTENIMGEVVWPVVVLCHAWPATFNFAPEDWLRTGASVHSAFDFPDDETISLDVDYVDASSVGQNGDGKCMRVRPNGLRVESPRSYLEIHFGHHYDDPKFAMNLCAYPKNETACYSWGYVWWAQTIVDSMQVFIGDYDPVAGGYRLWLPTKHDTTIYMIPSKFIDIQGDSSVAIAMSTVSLPYMTMPQIPPTTNSSFSQLWFNWPSPTMAVYEDRSQRTLETLYAQLFAVLSSASFIFCLFVVPDEDEKRLTFRKTFIHLRNQGLQVAEGTYRKSSELLVRPKAGA